jgi:multiple sugar transport system permease protein
MPHGASVIVEHMSTDAATLTAPRKGRRRRVMNLLTKKDKTALTFMTGIPTVIHVFFVWIPALATVVLSFTKWDGLGDLSKIRWVGFRNYWEIFTVFEETLSAALFNNLILLVFLFLGPTLLGMLLAYLLDKNIRGTRIYQSIYYFPVVLSLAVVGIIWKSVIFSPGQGMLNTVLGRTKGSNQIDWLGKSQKLFSFHIPGLDNAIGPSRNFVVILFAIAWRHAGYIMVLYLAGLKSVDPSLREAAAIDGCNEWQAFRRVVLPTMKPINIIIVVITIIESLRTFDIIAALKNPLGMELTSLLVTQNLLGEGGGQVGRGSAYGVILLVLCVGFIIWYVINNFKEENA